MLRISLFTALILALSAQSSSAQDCQPFPKMEEWLTKKHHESVIGGGISEMDNTMVMLFSKPDGSTFTVLKVSPKGMACIVDIGTNWQIRSDPAPEAEESL